MNESSSALPSGHTGDGGPCHAVRATSDGDVAYCGAGRIAASLAEEFSVSSPDACPSCIAQILLDGMGPR